MSSRNFCFTHNNYTEEIEAAWKSVPCKFIQYGREVAKSGTRHLQGFIMFPNAKSLSAAIKCCPKGAHIEMCKGTANQNIKYTGKDKDVFCAGVPPVTNEEKGKKGEEYYKNARIAMQTGDEDNIPEYFKTVKPDLVKRHRRDYLSTLLQEDVVREHDWYYGEPDTGKSRKAREVAGKDFYEKDMSKWWDGYTNQDTVILDDLDRSHAWMLNALKRCGDRYPFAAEAKGQGKVQIRPKHIIVTSNYSIEEIWPDPQDHKPLKKRFKQTHFK